MDIRELFAGGGSKVKLNSGTPADIVEQIAKGLRVIATDHAQIHEGHGFVFSHIFEGVGADASVYVQFKVPAAGASGPYVHMKKWSVSVKGGQSSAVELEILDNPSLTDGTTEKPARNRRRISPITASQVTCYTDPTGVTGGTTLEDVLDGGNRGAGGLADDEIILRPDASTVFKLTNVGTGSADLGLKVFWYEEDAA